MTFKPKTDDPIATEGAQDTVELRRGPREETYYEILKVDPKATVPEIVAAYHRARNAFSKDSVATYSLFDEGEAERMLGKFEEAYSTLTNLERREEYDSRLAQGLPYIPSVKTPATELELKRKAAASAEQPVPSSDATPVTAPAAGNEALETVDGTALKKIRERRGLSVEDVARITKIPARYIRAIEADELRVLPAKVYLQGFVTNLSHLYGLSPKETSASYFDFYQRKILNKE